MVKIDAQFARAPVIASLIAGPVFLLSAVVTVAVLFPSQAIPVAADSIVTVAMVAVITTIIGFLIALLPTAIGTGIMAWVGCASPVSRLPVVWGFVGAATVAVLAWLPDGFGHGNARMGIAMTITGGVCALICRRYTRWIEQEESAAPLPERTTLSPRECDPDPRLLR